MNRLHALVALFFLGYGVFVSHGAHALAGLVEPQGSGHFALAVPGDDLKTTDCCKVSDAGNDHDVAGCVADCPCMAAQVSLFPSRAGLQPVYDVSPGKLVPQATQPCMKPPKSS
ncbi:hypothetical protein [Hoeflea sp.]|uniref:hypothetical protein n=1 Tax=Hoeflea sp. TaxID=1940281 RepID=UPI003BB10548